MFINNYIYISGPVTANEYIFICFRTKTHELTIIYIFQDQNHKITNIYLFQDQELPININIYISEP